MEFARYPQASVSGQSKNEPPIVIAAGVDYRINRFLTDEDLPFPVSLRSALDLLEWTHGQQSTPDSLLKKLLGTPQLYQDRGWCKPFEEPSSAVIGVALCHGHESTILVEKLIL